MMRHEIDEACLQEEAPAVLTGISEGFLLFTLLVLGQALQNNHIWLIYEKTGRAHPRPGAKGPKAARVQITGTSSKQKEQLHIWFYALKEEAER